MSVLRRFWTAAGVVPHADGWAVALDGKIARTPLRQPLATRHKRLAEAAAAEWSGAGETVDPRAMPLTGFMNAVIDRVRPNHAALAADVAKFAATELLCYRADGPDELCRRQALAWDPILTWARARYDACLTVNSGIMPVSQSHEALTRLTAAVQGLDADRLAAALKISGILKSLALTLAVIESERDAITAYDLSRIDETFQAEYWGEDVEAARRTAKEREEMMIAGKFLRLLD